MIASPLLSPHPHSALRAQLLRNLIYKLARVLLANAPLSVPSLPLRELAFEDVSTLQHLQKRLHLRLVPRYKPQEERQRRNKAVNYNIQRNKISKSANGKLTLLSSKN